MIYFISKQFSNAYASTMLFPFIPFMVQFLLPQVDKASIGKIMEFMSKFTIKYVKWLVACMFSLINISLCCRRCIKSVLFSPILHYQVNIRALLLDQCHLVKCALSKRLTCTQLLHFFSRCLCIHIACYGELCLIVLVVNQSCWLIWSL